MAEVVCNEVSKFGEAFLHEHDVRDYALWRIVGSLPMNLEYVEASPDLSELKGEDPKRR